MPKLIVGTGLSIIYGVSGMSQLANYLSEEIEKSTGEHIKELWEKYSDEIRTSGLGKN